MRLAGYAEWLSIIRKRNMIFAAILGYMFISVLNAGIFGGLLALLLSRPCKLVSIRSLGLGVFLFLVLSDLIMFAIVAPLDLNLMTENPSLIEIFGSPNLSDILRPSFDAFNIGFYALEVLVGTWFGRRVVTWYYRKREFPTTESNATSV